jgi:transposase
MKASVISIDLAKNVFQVCALNQANKVTSNVKVSRADLLNQIRQFEPTTVAMEACYSAHPWGRAIEAMGHQVKLIPPIKVKPFVQGNKNDRNDAVAIAEASLRPNINFVQVKSLEQQDIQSMQRIRERLIRQRTSLMNQIRGLLAEYHIVCEKKAYNLRKLLPLLIEDAEQPLTVISREFFDQLYSELCALDERVENITTHMQESLKNNPDYLRIQQVPGIGPIISAATIAAVGNANQFKNGRQFSAWLGLTPRHYASGDQCYNGGIGKRGNSQLNVLLIHGARTVMNWSAKKSDRLSLWVKNLMATKPACKVIVALANKLARILWVVLAKAENYQAA